MTERIRQSALQRAAVLRASEIQKRSCRRGEEDAIERGPFVAGKRVVK